MFDNKIVGNLESCSIRLRFDCFRFYLDFYLCFPAFSRRVNELRVLVLRLRFMFSACAYKTLRCC